MYKKVSTGLNFAEREQKILEFWKENNIFEKSIRLREGGPAFTFYDGPPTANGKPHIGMSSPAWSRILYRVIRL